jgi:hypothetical protein
MQNCREKSLQIEEREHFARRVVEVARDHRPMVVEVRHAHELDGPHQHTMN